MKKRLKVIQGGSSAGKTIAILSILIDICQAKEGHKLISIVSESVPHLKRGAIRDFLSIMQEQGYYRDASWNRTDFIYTFESGNKIEFFSADSPDKVRGPRRDILFINEANNISYETYTQLAIRTNEEIYIDFNPVAEFWAHTEVMPTVEHDFDILTYLDNEGLAPAIVTELESRKGNRMWWQVYGLGQTGELEAQIYRSWQVVDDIPFEARLERYGLDFGYAHDPTAIVAIYYYNGGYILDEIAYQTGLLNKPIADIFANQDQKALVIADSAEPKSIDELRLHGITVLPAQKGPGSINRGIAYVQQQRISVTKRSVNLLREYRNYLWETDRDGRIIPEATDINNHCMDALRYGMASIRDPNRMTAHVHYSPSAMPRPTMPLAPELNASARHPLAGTTLQPGAPPLAEADRPKTAYVHYPRL